jgi:putative membrane protein
MMFWYGHHVSGWGWFAMSAGMVLFWALIITVGVLLFRTLNSPDEHTHTHMPVAPTPEEILRERLARGEIDEEEYRRRLTTLHAGPLTKP